MLIYVPPEEPRHRDLDVSPTFAKDQALNLEKQKNETVTDASLMIRISNPRKASELSTKSTPRRTIPFTGATGHEDYTMDVTPARLMSSDTKHVTEPGLSCLLKKSVTAWS
jgi:hypothetical protein